MLHRFSAAASHQTGSDCSHFTVDGHTRPADWEHWVAPSRKVGNSWKQVSWIGPGPDHSLGVRGQVQVALEFLIALEGHTGFPGMFQDALKILQ